MPRQLLLLVLILVQTPPQTQTRATDLNEPFWDAARAGDTGRVAELLDKGVDVNAKARYDMTALIFAADKGQLAAVKLLLSRGATVGATDTFYGFHAIDAALMNRHAEVAIYLLEHGSPGADRALEAGGGYD